MGGLLHLVQRGEEWPGRAGAPPSPLLAVPNVTAYTSTASVPTSYYYAPARRERGNKRCCCPSVRPSVRPSRTWRIIREPKGLACPNLEGRFPTSAATCTPVSRSEGQRSRSPGPLMLTHIVRRIFRWYGTVWSCVQLQQHCGRELCIVVTNLSRMCSEYCTTQTCPDLPIRAAVRMSMAFPCTFVYPLRLI